MHRIPKYCPSLRPSSPMRHNGLMVSALTLNPAFWIQALAGVIVLCSWAQCTVQCLSLPGCINGYRRIHAGEQIYYQSLYASETGISSSLMGHLADMETSPLPNNDLLVSQLTPGFVLSLQHTKGSTLHGAESDQGEIYDVST